MFLLNSLTMITLCCICSILMLIVGKIWQILPKNTVWHLLTDDDWHFCKEKSKVKAFPYLIPSIGPRADPSVQAVSPQVTVSHPPGGRLPLLSTRPAVTSPAIEHHRPYTAWWQRHIGVTKLAQGCYAELPQVGFEPATYWSQVQLSICYTTAPPLWSMMY